MNIIETLYTITIGGHNVYSKFLTLTFVGQNVKSSRRFACLRSIRNIFFGVFSEYFRY